MVQCYTQDVEKGEKLGTSQLIFVIGVAVIVFMAGLLGFLWKKLPPELPWLYSMPWGEQQLVQREWMVGLLGGLLGFFVLTRILARWIGSDDETVKNTIIGGGLLVIVMCLTSFLRVISIILGL